MGATAEVVGGVWLTCACVIKLFLLTNTPDFTISNVGKDGGIS
jgi:hypothetical protein